MVKYIYISVELTTNSVNDTFVDFNKGKKDVESDVPSRWNNPVLIAVTPKEYSAIKVIEETGEWEGSVGSVIPDNVFNNRVVAVPMKGKKPYPWGYGYSFRNIVLKNRQKLVATRVRKHKRKVR